MKRIIKRRNGIIYVGKFAREQQERAMAILYIALGRQQGELD
jgi:hypothetical protein